MTRTYSTLLSLAVSFVAGLAGVAGCGALNDVDYEGDPRFVVESEIRGLDENRTPEAETYLAVFWSNFTAEGGDLVTSQLVKVSDAEFPAEFWLQLFDNPPVPALNDFNHPEAGTTGFIGTGYIGVFTDVDGDRILTGNDFESGPDQVRGLAPGHVMLFAQDVNEALVQYMRERGTLILNPEALRPGFNLARAVCDADQTRHYARDRLLIVPDEAVLVVSLADATESNCLDFY